jgi:hypothetical protein
MARETPDSTQAVLAIGDLRALLRQRLAADGETCERDQRALLLFDTAAYRFDRADLDRRKRQSYENYGRIGPRLLREEREMEREYAHVTGDRQAA